VWKVVLSVVNGSGASLVSLSPSFGLPALRLDGAVASGPPASLGELFAMYFTKTYLASTLDPQPELSQVVTGPPQSLLGASGLVLFTTDVMRAGCISYAQHVALGDNGVATPEMLQHPCPLPNQYTIVANDTAKTDLLNPLWSPCTTSATTGEHTFDFFRYESLLDAAGPSKETLAVREIFPRCLDFAGVDVGQLHHIPCGINKQFMLYSTSSQSLLVPAYTGALCNHFRHQHLQPQLVNALSNSVTDFCSLVFHSFQH
jgi:hypothetical protein